MSSAAIMDAVLTKIKTVLSESKEVLACDVSPEQAEEVSRMLGKAMSAGWTAGDGKGDITDFGKLENQ